MTDQCHECGKTLTQEEKPDGLCELHAEEYLKDKRSERYS